MTAPVDYAILAGASYFDTRRDKNLFPVPKGWHYISRFPQDELTGFEAAAFRNDSEIVISYAGTYDKSGADLGTNAALLTGQWSDQLLQAAKYYLQVKTDPANAGARLTLTGHSLGGGLASLVAVFFNESAVTFDQAPFRSAASASVANFLRNSLTQAYPAASYPQINVWLEPLNKFILSFDPLGIGMSPDGLAVRESRVTSTSVQGEFVSALSALRIGRELPSLTHGIYSSPVDLHSQALLTTFLQSPAFEDLAHRLPSLLSLIFDKKLFANDTDTDITNILEHLVRHQAGGVGGIPEGGDGMLERFTSDLEVLVPGEGVSRYVNLDKALIAFAMEAYYNETPDSPTRQKQLFEAVTGGLHFDTSGIASDITQAKGYAQYFKTYLDLEGMFNAEARALIAENISTLRDWHIATDTSSGMVAAARTRQGALMLGNDGSDRLTGGAGNDLLAGARGDDRFDGGDGADTLLGGVGNDTYTVDAADTINDSDGQGRVILKGQQLTLATRKKGDTAYKDEAGNIYILNGARLQINESLDIDNFTSGDLGLTLEEKLDPDDPGDPPLKKPFGEAENAPSPIVLDLDGNGLSTRGIGEGAFFDYDGNGFAERTGWLNADDGLLVRDRNGDGRIRTGDELFGDHTLLKNGQRAANGYAALADVDENADGRIDSQDSVWNELQIWQDANSDGISQSGELKRLGDLGLQSVSTHYTSMASTDSHGNRNLQQGRFGRTDGSGGASADLWFRSNPSSTRQDNPLTLTEDIRTLPEIQGMGNVASLRQVMAQQAASNVHHLRDLVEQFAREPSPLARNDLTTRIIYAWTGVEDKDPQSRAEARFHGNAIGDARKLYAMEALLGKAYEGVWCWPEKVTNPHRPAAAILLKGFDDFANGIAAQLMQQTQLKDLYRAITYSWDAATQRVKGDLTGTVPFLSANITADREQGKAALQTFITNLTYTHKLSELDTYAFQVALAALGEDVVSAARIAWRGMVPTQGNDHMTGDARDERIAGWSGNDLIEAGGGNDTLLGDAGDDRLYGEVDNDILDGGPGNDLLDGGTGSDCYLFGRGSGQDTIYSQDSAADKKDTLKLGAGVASSDIVLVRYADDLVLTIRDSGDQITVHKYFAGDGTLVSYLEAIEFADGTQWDYATVKKMLPAAGTADSDRIRGYNTAERIEGLGGNDLIESRGGNDTLEGGSGNDTLDGGTGSDTYLFGRGDGQDSILSDAPDLAKEDVVQFKPGVAATDVMLSRQSDNLILKIAGTADQLTLQRYFWGDAEARDYGVDSICFADGTRWDYATVKDKTLAAAPTEGNDTIYGYSTDDVLNGLGGDDYLYGNGGNDTLEGGAGHDTLDGGTGNDIYLFGRGDGQDELVSFDNTPTKQDVLQFKAGVASADVAVSRQGDKLILKIAGGSDQLTLQSYFTYDGTFSPDGAESIRFSDGSPVWRSTDIKARLVLASEDPDILIGYSSNDVLDGLGGDDQLIGGAGDDTLAGGVGNDTLDGGAGNDTYLFGRGDGQDMLSGYALKRTSQDVLQFKAGVASADVLASRSGYDLQLKIAGTTDQLTLQNYFWNGNETWAYAVDLIRFADGTQWDIATVKKNVLAAALTEGNDVAYGYSTDDVLNGMSGDDRLFGEDGNDTLNGAMGSDTLKGGNGDDTLDGGENNDVLDGGYGNDTYLFGRGDGQDVVSSYDPAWAKQDVVQFKASVAATDVAMHRQGDDLILNIIGTTDQLTLQKYFGNDGEPRVYGVESIRFADGTQWDYAAVKDKTLAAAPTDGNDAVYGYSTDDVLYGLGGDDSLYGFGGHDTLEGGQGNDVLDGGIGNDTYLFGRGDGQDVLLSYEGVMVKKDVVKFKAGVAASDVALNRQGDNLILKIDGTTDQLTLQNYFYFDDSNPYGIEFIEFSDGSPAWSCADVRARLLLASEGDDALSAYGTDDVLEGLDGDDKLYGNGGNDTLNGGRGNDRLDGGYGNDIYLFGRGDGQDIILSYELDPDKYDVVQFKAGVAAADVALRRQGNDLILRIAGTTDQLTLESYFWCDGDGRRPYRVESIQFADGSPAWFYADVNAKLPVATEGNDALNGDSTDDLLDGLGGNDTLVGGAGNDTLDGRAGNDRLDGGMGNDTYLFGRGDGQDVLSSYEAETGKQDVVQFKAGIRAADVVMRRQIDSLILKIANTDDQLILQNYFNNDGAFNGYGIETIRIADGLRWDYAAVKSALLVATEGNDALYGYQTNDVINGLAGDDHLEGKGGNDTLDGGAGNDWASGGEGDDIIHGGIGDDAISGLSGNDSLQGNAGYDRIFGNEGDDLLEGGGENDYLSGESGNDTLDGGQGNDTLDGGIGNDTYLFGRGDGQDVLSTDDPAQGKKDVLQFKAGVTAGDVLARRQGDDLTLSIVGSSDGLTVQKYFSKMGAPAGVESIQFADGSPAWDFAEVTARLLRGSEGNDAINGSDADDVLTGLGGDDSLSGGMGKDTLDGGRGNDTLGGGLGNDTYLFTPGDGQDIIDDYDMTDGNVDTVRLGPGVRPSDVKVSGDYADLFLALDGGQDRLKLASWFYSDENKIERVEFDDGTAWNVDDLKALAHTGDDGDNTLGGSTDDDVLNGAGGNDRVSGETGNDALSGGAGNDSLAGGGGNDLLEGGHGNDTLDGGYGNDTYLFGRGDGQDVLLSYDPAHVKQDIVEFKADVTPKDVVMSRKGYDLILSIAGTADQLTVQYGLWSNGSSRPYGIESIRFADGSPDWGYAEMKARLLAGSEGDDELFSDAADDMIAGLGGKDTLAGGGGSDTLDGGAGDDQLFGQEGNDQLDGGAGNDQLDGSVGNDRYLFGPGSGQDVITDSDKSVGNVDTVTLAEGVLPTQIRVTRDALNLYLGLNNGADQLTLSKWFEGDEFKVEQVRFADGTVWDTAYLKALSSNTAPVVATLLAGQLATAGKVFTYTLPDTAFADADAGDALSYNLTLSDGQPLPAWLAFDAATRTLSGTPARSDAGTLDFRITATDWAGASASQDLLLKIEAPLTVGVNLKGTARNNTLTGAAGNDTLDGGRGRDRMIGGAGDDTYYVDNRGDAIVERPGEGNDTVISTVSHTLAAHVENLVLTGRARLSGSGNDLDNRITGNAGHNTLNGGAGADTLDGGRGDDTYTVDNPGDVIIERASEGADQVSASVSTTLSDHVETLTLVGADAINGRGNAFANTLTGNMARNQLQGGAGHDTLKGGGGMDFLEGGDGNDVLNDTVGAGYFNGGAGVDRLRGGAGSDLFLGGQGNDTLVTGNGNDVILFNKGDGQDLITRGGSRSDTLSLGGSLAYSDLALSKVGKDLVLTMDTTGAADRVTFQGWYAARPSRPVLKLQVIAEAMAGFDAGGSDPLLDQKVESFDFAGLAHAFDAARKAAPTLNRWSLTQALLDFQLAGSDNAAVGGDLAYQYGKTGALSSVSLSAAEALIGDRGFGARAQALQAPDSLQEGALRLG